MKLGNPSKEEEYILTLEEKKKTFIPKSVVSKSVYDKLTSLGIKTVGDVLARGHVEMEALTNTATVSKIDAFMRTMGLSLFPRIREESEASFNARDDDEKEFVILSNLTNNFTRVPSSTLGIAVPCVCGLDGSFVGPEAQWILASKFVSMGKRWEGCPVFDTFENLIENGILPLPTAAVTHVKMADGSFRSLYSLKETSLYKNNKEAYDDYLKALETKVPDMGLLKGMLAFYRNADKEKAATSLIVANENCRTPEGKAPSFVESVGEEARACLCRNVSDADFSMGSSVDPTGRPSKDVFGIGELDGASKATLKVLKDFVDCGTGTGLEKNSTVSERNGAVAGYSSSDGLSYHRQGAPKPSSLNSMNDVTNIQKNTDYIKRKIKEYRNEHNIVIRRNSENELVRTISRYFNFQKLRSSNSYYQDYFEGDVEYNGKTVRIRISQHPANKDRMCGLPVDDIVSIVIYRIPLRNLGK